MCDGFPGTVNRVQGNFDRQLATFLKKERGQMSYADFAKKVGVSHTTLHRVERGEHHLTLNKLEGILKRLRKCLCDVFPDQFPGA